MCRYVLVCKVSEPEIPVLQMNPNRLASKKFDIKMRPKKLAEGESFFPSSSEISDTEIEKNSRKNNTEM